MLVIGYSNYWVYFCLFRYLSGNCLLVRDMIRLEGGRSTGVSREALEDMIFGFWFFCV